MIARILVYLVLCCVYVIYKHKKIDDEWAKNIYEEVTPQMLKEKKNEKERQIVLAAMVWGIFVFWEILSACFTN